MMGGRFSGPAGAPAGLADLRIIGCGSRAWVDPTLIDTTVARLAGRYRIVAAAHGAQRGADTLFGSACRAAGLDVRPFPADWDRLGNPAGMIRNRQMLDWLVGDTVPAGVRLGVVAFHDTFDEHARRGAGTAGMVRIARSAGVPALIVSHTGTRLLSSTSQPALPELSQ